MKNNNYFWAQIKQSDRIRLFPSKYPYLKSVGKYVIVRKIDTRDEAYEITVPSTGEIYEHGPLFCKTFLIADRDKATQKVVFYTLDMLKDAAGSSDWAA